MKSKRMNQGGIIGFLHVPKAAGGTINAILNKNYDQDEIFRITSKPSYSYYVDMLKAGRFDQDKNKIIFGHYSFHVVKYFPEKTRMVSMLREPVGRVLSYYQWAKRNPNHFLYEIINGNGYTINDCIENKVSIELNNGQTRLMAGLDMHEDISGDCWANVKFDDGMHDMLLLAKSNINRRFEFVGLQEYFYVSLWMFRELFGWDMTGYCDRNVTSVEDKVKIEDDSFIRKYNGLDIDLYDHVLNNFMEDVSEMDGHSYLTKEDLEAFNVECQRRLEGAGVTRSVESGYFSKAKNIFSSILPK